MRRIFIQTFFVLFFLQNFAIFFASTQNTKKPLNVILLLADDLGYGDLSVSPFLGSQVQTPELEKMASRGLIMTNFHTAAPTCTPTRASILTGLHPWRLGIKAVYEYGVKGKSNRDDFLPSVFTSAMGFNNAGYFTGHSGKWHVGGMRNDDLAMRKLPEHNVIVNNTLFGRRCPHPGPNQQGFQTYVSVLDGPGAPRQNELQVPGTLYSQGCKYLLKNDNSLPSEETVPGEFLSHCEVRHAISMMNTSLSQNKPFFIQIWFHAPHGPWEYIPGHENVYIDAATSNPKKPLSSYVKCNQGAPYNDQLCFSVKENKLIKNPHFYPQKMDQYRSMITSMDAAIGKLLNYLKETNIEKDTLVVFTSDNGPEVDAGTTPHPWNTLHGLKGNKRTLYEGGIRVPAIWQWVDTIPKGRSSSLFSTSTDLLPTFFDAAGFTLPADIQIDGISLLPELIGHSIGFSQLSPNKSSSSLTTPQSPTQTNTAMTSTKSSMTSSSFSSSSSSSNHVLLTHHHERKQLRKLSSQRIYLWASDFEGPKTTMIWIYDFKIFLNASDHPMEIYDLQSDIYEKNNLIKNLTSMSLSDIFQIGRLAGKRNQNFSPSDFYVTSTSSSSSSSSSSTSSTFSRSTNSDLHFWLIYRTYRILLTFANHGNDAHQLYLKNNPGRFYTPTIESDTRYILGNNIYKGTTQQAALELKQRVIFEGSCLLPCSCDVEKENSNRFPFIIPIPTQTNTNININPITNTHPHPPLLSISSSSSSNNITIPIPIHPYPPSLPFHLISKKFQSLNPHGYRDGQAFLWPKKYNNNHNHHHMINSKIAHSEQQQQQQQSIIDESSFDEDLFIN